MSTKSISARGSAGLPVAVSNPCSVITLELRHCDVAEAEHAENRRQYAHTFHYPGTICLVDAFWRLPKELLDGIMLHEFGHVIAGHDASEAEANHEIERITSSKIFHVNSRYGQNLEAATPTGRILQMAFDRNAGRGAASLRLPHAFLGSGR